MLTFICYPKCSTCQKAKAFLDEVGAEYMMRDIKANNPKYGELKAWLSVGKYPVKKLFNTSGQLYRSLNIKERLPALDEDECLRLLASDGMLVKRPLLVDGQHAIIGFKREEWLAALQSADTSSVKQSKADE